MLPQPVGLRLDCLGCPHVVALAPACQPLTKPGSLCLLPTPGWDCSLCIPIIPCVALGLGMDTLALDGQLTGCLLLACCLPSSAGLSLFHFKRGGLGKSCPQGLGVTERRWSDMHAPFPQVPAQWSGIQARTGPGKVSVGFGPGCTTGSPIPLSIFHQFLSLQ